MKKRQILIGVCAALLLSLSACGFQPLYGEHSPGHSVTAELQNISIPESSTRLGTILRNHLMDNLSTTSGNAARYRLSMKTTERQRGSALRIDASITRFNYHLKADYVLLDTQTGKQVFDGSSNSVVAYDVVESQFATLIARQDAEDRAAREVSDLIQLRLALFFNSQMETEVKS